MLPPLLVHRCRRADLRISVMSAAIALGPWLPAKRVQHLAGFHANLHHPRQCCARRPRIVPFNAAVQQATPTFSGGGNDEPPGKKRTAYGPEGAGSTVRNTLVFMALFRNERCNCAHICNERCNCAKSLASSQTCAAFGRFSGQPTPPAAVLSTASAQYLVQRCCAGGCANLQRWGQRRTSSQKGHSLWPRRRRQHCA
jgi:hypothetical protein